MSQYSPYIVSGLVSGSILAIAALGLVLSYKTSGLLNFGHGALSAAGAYIFFDLNTRNHVPWPIAALLSVVLFGVVAGAVMERMSRGLSGLATANRVVATVGLLIAIQQFAIIRYGATAINVPHFLPTASHKLGGVYVTDEQMIVFAVGLISAVVLYLFFRLTRLGRPMRAVVDDPALLDMTGFDPNRVRRLAWIISCSFAALSGVLFAPEFVLDATLLTLLIVQAFSAAAIGMFSSLPLVYVGGLVVGVLQQVFTKFGAAHQALSGLPSSVPFLVLLVVLLAAGPRLRELGSSDRAMLRVRSMTAKSRLAAPTLVAAVLLVVPWVTGAKLAIWTNGLAEVILFLSLGLLVRMAGMVSLCQVTFAAVGAAAFGHLAGQWGVPWLVSSSSPVSSPSRSVRWWRSRPSGCPASTWLWPRSPSASSCRRSSTTSHSSSEASARSC
jgi:branched-subunit amino acid ABC-type transport system permease component